MQTKLKFSNFLSSFVSCNQAMYSPAIHGTQWRTTFFLPTDDLIRFHLLTIFLLHGFLQSLIRLTDLTLGSSLERRLLFIFAEMQTFC